MENYEQIISDIESEMNKKCDEPRVGEIVKEELELNSCNEPMAKKIVEEVIAREGKNLQTRQPKIETITTVTDELNEKKNKGDKFINIWSKRKRFIDITRERRTRH
jgi:hypothetical protein